MILYNTWTLDGGTGGWIIEAGGWSLRINGSLSEEPERGILINMTRYIASDPEIMSGTPVIRGTRVPISRIVFLLSEGHTLNSIHDLYPHIKEEVLQGAIEELIEDIDAKQYEKASAV